MNKRTVFFGSFFALSGLLLNVGCGFGKDVSSYTEVEFNNAPSIERGCVLANYLKQKPDFGYPGKLGTDNVMIAFEDMNGDGLKDAILRFESVITCGSGGCSTGIMLNKGECSFGEYTGTPNTFGAFYVSSTYSNGLKGIGWYSNSYKKNIFSGWDGQKFTCINCD